MLISEGTRVALSRNRRSRGATLVDTAFNTLSGSSADHDIVQLCCDHSWLCAGARTTRTPYLRLGAFFGQPLTSAFARWPLSPELPLCSGSLSGATRLLLSISASQTVCSCT